MSETHRIEGIKFNFDRLTRDEIEGIRGHLVERHARVVGEIALVESFLNPSQQEALFDADYLAGYGELADGVQ